MKLSTILGITLLVCIGSLWFMSKLAAGQGINAPDYDLNQPRIEWVMSMEEKVDQDIPDLFDLLEEDEITAEEGQDP